MAGRTFLSLFFSAVSSLPALAACRFSCFAVNYTRKRMGLAIRSSGELFRKETFV